jgi:hypothetical protein
MGTNEGRGTCLATLAVFAGKRVYVAAGSAYICVYSLVLFPLAPGQDIIDRQAESKQDQVPHLIGTIAS